MNKSESIKEIASALAQCQGEMKNPPKSADNPFFKSKYSTLDTIIDTVRPVMAKYGLSYIQSCSSQEQNISVTTLLMHTSGEWIESDPMTVRATKLDPQGAGSAITYARRYTLAAMLGIASEEDDDGNGASSNTSKKGTDNKAAKKEAQTKEPPKDIISELQAKRIFAMAKGNIDLVRSAINEFGYTSSKEIKKADYEKICAIIEDKA